MFSRTKKITEKLGELRVLFSPCGRKDLTQMNQLTSIQAYNLPNRASEYHTRTGFDPARKSNMLAVALRLLIEMAPKDSKLLELGAGTGLFTQSILDTGHFAEVHVTDGAPAMIHIARQTLGANDARLKFSLLDFTQRDWPDSLSSSFDVVTSSMAIHHASNKQLLFQRVHEVLGSNGVFVFADHIAGTSSAIDDLIGQERGRVKLTAQGKDPQDMEAMRDFLQSDQAKQAAEGNRCESVSQYMAYLREAGFQHADCLWRDYWLAVFVAIK